MNKYKTKNKSEIINDRYIHESYLHRPMMGGISASLA